MRLKPLAVFRADATPQIGAGHVMRCLALAERLQEDGWDTAIAIGRDGGDAMPAFATERLDIVTLDVAAKDEVVAMAAQWPGGCNLLVVDHYGRGAEFEHACRPWAAKILAFDDLLDRTHDSDFLVDPAPGRGGDDYAQSVPDNCLRLFGPAYMPLRSGFARARESTLFRRAVADTPRCVLTSTVQSISCSAATRRTLGRSAFLRRHPCPAPSCTRRWMMSRPSSRQAILRLEPAVSARSNGAALVYRPWWSVPQPTNARQRRVWPSPGRQGSSVTNPVPELTQWRTAWVRFLPILPNGFA